MPMLALQDSPPAAAARRPATGDARVPAHGAVMQVVLSLGAGGTERLVIEIVKRLAQPYPMIVCCLDDAGAWAGELTSIGVPVVPLHRRPGFHPSLGARIGALARRHGVRVIHCHHYSSFVYGRLATLTAPGTGLVFTEHGRLSDAPPTLKRRAANVVLGRLCGTAYAVSAALREHMIAEGFPRHRVGVIHNGIEAGPRPAAADRAAARTLLGVPPDACVLGTVARLDTVKDLPGLVAAVARLRADVSHVRLVIAGDGDERPTIEEAIRAHGCDDIVHMLGHRQDARRLMPGFDVYVNASISEGVSLTILEAMAAALPVVATGVGGTPEVVEDGVTGLLVPARNADAMATALRSLAVDPARRARFGDAARIRLEQQFTLDRMVEAYAREYARLGRR